MISTQDLYSEIEKYDALTKDEVEKIDDVTFKKALIKSNLLIAKLAHNNRTNLVNIMKALNKVLEYLKLEPIKLIEGRRRDNEENKL